MEGLIELEFGLFVIQAILGGREYMGRIRLPTGGITEGNEIEDWLNEAERTLYTFLFFNS